MIPAVLVLGCGVTRDGLPSELFQDRLDMAINVIEQFGVNLAIIAGRGALPKHSPEDPDIPNPPGRTEADIGEWYLRKRGIAPDSVRLLKETFSMETLGNYIFATWAFLQPLRVSKVVTVTSPGHSNRCQHYASRLWASLPNRIEHIVVHGGQISRTTEMGELARSDFVWDFINSDNTSTLAGALDWIKRTHENKCKDYPTLEEAKDALQHQLGSELQQLVTALEDSASKLGRWTNEFTSEGELLRRRRMYRVSVQKLRGPSQQGTGPRDLITEDDCSRVFRPIAELGLHTLENEQAKRMSQMLVHHIPIKFWRIFQDHFSLEQQDHELCRGFMRMLVLAIEYVTEKQHRQVVEIRAGQGEDLTPITITKTDMDQMKQEAMAYLTPEAVP